MPAIKCDKLIRSEIRAHPQWLYVFGDNLERRGFGGQAKECRGEPNCVGIPTKRAPHMGGSAFLYDDDFDEWAVEASIGFVKIHDALAAGKVVVFPTVGIGTGLARLQHTSPKIWNHLNNKLNFYFENYPEETCG